MPRKGSDVDGAVRSARTVWWVIGVIAAIFVAAYALTALTFRYSAIPAQVKANTDSIEAHRKRMDTMELYMVRIGDRDSVMLEGIGCYLEAHVGVGERTLDECALRRQIRDR
jgi:hypothetical protein